MKYLKIFALLTLFWACSNSTENEEHIFYKAVSEIQVCENSYLRANLGAVIAIQLENVQTPTNDYEKDTGGRGLDAIPITVINSGTYIFSRDTSVNCTLKLYNNANSTYTDILTETDTIKSIRLEKGDYILQFRAVNEYSAEGTNYQTVFMYPLGGNTDVFNQKISSRECKNSDLSGINLTNYIMNGINFSGSDLSSATLRNAEFRQSKCVGTNFSYATLFAANLVSSDLQYANFYKADIQYCAISHSIVNYASFCEATFYGWISAGLIYDRSNTSAIPQCMPNEH